MRDGRGDSEFAQDVREITMDELREFLEADLGGATADPKFKEELRQTLWDFLQRKNDRVEIDGNGS
jgi:hypothetical protein